MNDYQLTKSQIDLINTITRMGGLVKAEELPKVGEATLKKLLQEGIINRIYTRKDNGFQTYFIIEGKPIPKTINRRKVFTSWEECEFLLNKYKY